LIITLTTTNAAAGAVNDDHLSALKGREYLQRAEISGDFGREYYPTATDLYFKIGAQIMMLNNDSKGRWVNGSMGVILGLATDDDGHDHLKVRLQDDVDPVDVYPFMWEVFKFKIVDGAITSDPVGTFTQYPFRLAWAVTIHKSQGKTFDHVIVDIGRGTFAAGQLYVALSRCTSFGGLCLKTPIKKHHVMTDHKIGRFLIADQTQAAAKRLPLDDKVTMINQAVAARQALQITYIKPDETTTTRVIDPLSVGPEAYRGTEFLGLRAWCHERQDNRIFRVDRILEIAVIAKTAAKKAQR
jgi:ATP-dependent DNA helicase PIF1